MLYGEIGAASREHNMYYTQCTDCDYSDFSKNILSSNSFYLNSWFYLGYGYKSQYLEDGEASIQIDSNGMPVVGNPHIQRAVAVPLSI